MRFLSLNHDSYFRLTFCVYYLRIDANINQHDVVYKNLRRLLSADAPNISVRQLVACFTPVLSFENHLIKLEGPGGGGDNNYSRHISPSSLVKKMFETKQSAKLLYILHKNYYFAYYLRLNQAALSGGTTVDLCVRLGDIFTLLSDSNSRIVSLRGEGTFSFQAASRLVATVEPALFLFLLLNLPYKQKLFQYYYTWLIFEFYHVPIFTDKFLAALTAEDLFFFASHFYHNYASYLSVNKTRANALWPFSCQDASTVFMRLFNETRQTVRTLAPHSFSKEHFYQVNFNDRTLILSDCVNEAAITRAFVCDNQHVVARKQNTQNIYLFDARCALVQIGGKPPRFCFNIDEKYSAICIDNVAFTFDNDIQHTRQQLDVSLLPALLASFFVHTHFEEIYAIEIKNNAVYTVRTGTAVASKSSFEICAPYSLWKTVDEHTLPLVLLLFFSIELSTLSSKLTTASNPYDALFVDFLFQSKPRQLVTEMTPPSPFLQTYLSTRFTCQATNEIDTSKLNSLAFSHNNQKIHIDMSAARNLVTRVDYEFYFSNTKYFVTRAAASLRVGCFFLAHETNSAYYYLFACQLAAPARLEHYQKDTFVASDVENAPIVTTFETTMQQGQVTRVSHNWHVTSSTYQVSTTNNGWFQAGKTTFSIFEAPQAISLRFAASLVLELTGPSHFSLKIKT